MRCGIVLSKQTLGEAVASQKSAAHHLKEAEKSHATFLTDQKRIAVEIGVGTGVFDVSAHAGMIAVNGMR